MALWTAVTAAGGLACAEPRSADPGRVYPDAESVEPLAAGDRVPSVGVRSVDGQPVDLATLTRDRGALLVFYRGGW